MMKNYKLTTVLVLLISVVFASYGQNVSFNVNLNDTAYPGAGMQVSIAANPLGTGWDTDLIILKEDPDNLGYYVGTHYDATGNFPTGNLEFRIYQNTIGTTANWSGTFITDMNGNPAGCTPAQNNESNYQYAIADGVDVTLNLVPNSCYTVTSGLTLSNKSFDLVNFSVSPNPAQNVLNITSSEKINSFSIYTLLGSKIVANRKYNEGQSIDVSSLVSGMYIIEVESEGLKSTVKFVKN